MQMRMMQKVLSPGVKDCEKAYLRAKVFRIGCDRAQSFRSSSKEDVVNDALVLKSNHRELLWQSEDDMEVFDGQQIGLSISKPAGFRQRLTLGAVPIATRVVRDAPEAARVAQIDMPAENACPTLLDGSHHAALFWHERVRQPEVGTVLAEDVCYLECRSHAQARFDLTGFARNSNGLSVARTVFSET